MFTKSVPVVDENNMGMQKQFSDFEGQEVHSKNMFLPEGLGGADSSGDPISFKNLSQSMTQNAAGFRKHGVSNRASGALVQVHADEAVPGSPRRGKGKAGSLATKKIMELIIPDHRGVKLSDAEGDRPTTPKSKGLFSPLSKSSKSSTLGSRVKANSLLSEPGEAGHIHAAHSRKSLGTLGASMLK